jgi:putative ABC transport system permease protein
LKIKKELENMGMYVYPIKQLEELLFSKSLIQGTLYVISLLLLLAVIGIMCNILRMIIQSRIKLIGILRAMGMSINSITLLYMSVFEVVIISSVLFGSIIGYIFNNYSSNLLTTLFPEDVGGYLYEVKSILITLILSNILLLIPWRVMINEIDKLSVVQIVNSEN